MRRYEEECRKGVEERDGCGVFGKSAEGCGGMGGLRRTEKECRRVWSNGTVAERRACGKVRRNGTVAEVWGECGGMWRSGRVAVGFGGSAE